MTFIVNGRKVKDISEATAALADAKARNDAHAIRQAEAVIRKYHKRLGWAA